MTDNLQTIEEAMRNLSADNADLRAAAIEALGQHAHKPAVEPLTTLVEDVDPGTRYMIVQALGRIASPQAAPTLLKALRWDDIFTRAAATGALIQIGEPAVDGLADALRDENKMVRRAAAKALGKIGIASDAALTGLSTALLDVDSSVRRFAAEALGRLGDATMVPELAQALDDKDPKAKIAAFRALAKIDSPEARELVRAWVKQ